MGEFTDRESGYISESISGPVGTGLSRNSNVPRPGTRGRNIITASNSVSVVGVNPTSILANNTRRGYLFIQNLGTFNIFLSFGSLPNTSAGFPGGILIPPTGFYEPQYPMPVDTIYAVASAGSNQVTIVQGIWAGTYE